MKILPGEQGSQAWHEARLGLPTASQFHRILSPAKLEPSTQAFEYLCQLLFERFTGQSATAETTQFMERGSVLEAEGVAWYELERNVDTERVGLCVSDDGLVGCSPDRLVGSEGGLELKCPSGPTHIGYLLEGISQRYRLQVQGALWITGRYWWDLASYSPVPELKSTVVRIIPEAKVFAALNDEIPAFCQRLDRATEKLGGRPKIEIAELLERSIEHARAERGLPQERLPL